jgi:hypothetical protein
MIIKHNLKTGEISIDSAKDIHADMVYFQEGDAMLYLSGYSSNPNTDAINAQANREIGMTQAITDAILKAIAAGAGVVKP